MMTLLVAPANKFFYPRVKSQISLSGVQESFCSWASLREKKLTLLHVNNKGADQPAQLRSLINAFAIRYLENTEVQLAPCNI